MKQQLKKYEKPTIELMDVQWNECIASSGISGAGWSVDVQRTQDMNQITGWGFEDSGSNGSGYWGGSF